MSDNTFFNLIQLLKSEQSTQCDAGGKKKSRVVSTEVGTICFFTKRKEERKCNNLVIEISRIPLVVLVTAVFSGGLLPLGVVSHVMFKNAGEGHRGQHAHHGSQGQHQSHHNAGKVHSANGVQGH